MKTILGTLTGLIIIVLLTSVGVNNGSQSNETVLNLKASSIEEAHSLAEMFEAIEEDNNASIEDINVYEIEEEVEFDFNTSDHLPTGFNPYEGMGTVKELEKEEMMSLEAIIVNALQDNSINIEDIDVYEIEEDVEFDFNTSDYLPAGFAPYEGMGTVKELEKEEAISIEAMIVNVVQDDSIYIEDIDVYEIEEEVELDFNTSDYLPKGFNPYKGMALINEL